MADQRTTASPRNYMRCTESFIVLLFSLFSFSLFLKWFEKNMFSPRSTAFLQLIPWEPVYILQSVNEAKITSKIITPNDCVLHTYNIYLNIYIYKQRAYISWVLLHRNGREEKAVLFWCLTGTLAALTPTTPILWLSNILLLWCIIYYQRTIHQI